MLAVTIDLTRHNLDDENKRQMIMDNFWDKIQLEDYELHMKLASAGQLQLLNDLTKKNLRKLNPEIAIFLGVTGGNGLEHINNKVTKGVFGIDINQDFLDETAKRYKKQIPKPSRLNIDISSKKQNINQSKFYLGCINF